MPVRTTPGTIIKNKYKITSALIDCTQFQQTANEPVSIEGKFRLIECTMNRSHEDDPLKGAKAFDLSSLAAVYDETSPRLYRYAMRLLGDETLAEECVSETFARFLKALRAGNGPESHLQAYLFRIAHNWITDCYRREPPPPLELDESLRGSDETLPEAQTDLHLEQMQVQRALRALTPDQRLVITLRFIEGWENDAVAAALEKPIGAVKALQHRALQSLRRWLLNEQEGNE